MVGLEHLGKGIRVEYNREAVAVVSIPMREFPIKLWNEWNEDCKLNFNDERWMKAYNDHLKAKLYDEILLRQGKSTEQITELEEDEKVDSENPLGLMNPNM